jgi:hypothetical protein
MSGYADIPSSFPNANALFTMLSGSGTAAVQNALLRNQGATQDLADRATLRGLAPGLATGDPNATAGAAVLPGIGGTNTVGAMTGAGELGIKQQELALKLQIMKAARDQAASTINANDPNGSQGQGGTKGQDTPVGPFEEQMGNAEAPNPSAVNKGGYIGQFQFGAPRLAELGMYQPAPGEDVKSNQFGGTFNIPGFPNVKTKADFLASPQAQHAAFGAHVQDIDTAIAQTPGADKFDANGLRAVAHLGGNEGMRKFVATAGGFNPADSNGTSLSDYYTRFGAHGAAGLQAKFGSPHGPAGPPQAPGAAPGAPAPYQVAGPPVAPPGTGGGVPFGPPVNGQPPLPLSTRPTAGPPGTPGAAAPDLMGPRPLPPTGPGSPVATPASIANTPVVPAGPLNNQAIVGQPADSVAGGPPQALAPAPAPAAQAPAAPQLMPGATAQPPQPPGTSSLPPTKTDAALPPAPVPVLANGMTAAQWAGVKRELSTSMTPEQNAAIDAKMEAYRTANRAQAEQYFTLTNPTSQSRFGQLGTDPATGKPAYPIIQAGKLIGWSPAAQAPATAGYDQQSAAYHADIPVVQAASTSGRVAQASALQLNELADIIKDQKTGGIVPEFRAKMAAILESAGASKETQLSYTGMTGTESQILQKLAVATLGQNAKTDLGSNVGVESLHVYAQANPGVHMLETANTNVTNQIRVARALIDSYTTGLQAHFNQNQKSFIHGGAYDEPVSVFDGKWQQQNNPQIGAAAIGILNGDKYDSWKARVSPQEAFYAVQLAAHIDPNVMVPTASGVPQRASEILAHPAAPRPN